jgi:S1-C subfamily serine protease
MMKWLKTRLLISRRQALALLALGIVSSITTFLTAKHYGIDGSRVSEMLASVPQITYLSPNWAVPASMGLHESFVVVMLDTQVYPQTCLESIEDCPYAESSTISSKGSGIVAGHGTGISYIMTAAHVCEHMVYPGVLVDGIPYTYDYFSNVSIVDNTGKIRSATVADIDIENDLCLLMTRGIWAPAIPIAHAPVARGERVLNMAAPLGIFSPGMVLTFDGLYSGDDITGDSFFTIPAWPGSSGSPVLNEDGEILSIIHSATPTFPNIALGSNLDDVQRLMETNQELFD